MRCIIVTAAGWYDERKKTLGRLLEQIPEATVLTSRRPEHSSVWARRAWELAEEWDEPTVILNDDVFVCPDFLNVCERVVAAAPGRTISLHTSLPQAAKASGSWVRSYWLTGPGYILPRGVPTQLLDYWSKLPPRYGPNEDNVAIQWAWERQEPFWSTVPAIVKHDTATSSTLGYDDHQLRTCSVSWEDRPGPWNWSDGAAAPPFIENPWANSVALEARRMALHSGHPCQMCWNRGAVVGNAGLEMCGECLGSVVLPVLNSLRGAQ